MQDSCTPLHLIVERALEKNEDNTNQIKIINLMLKDKDINLNILDKRTALHHACEKRIDKQIILELLLRSNPNIQDIFNQTPFHLLCKTKPDFDIFKIFVEKTINFDSKDLFNRTPFHYLCKNEPISEIIDLLLKKGVDINSQDSYTPLHFLCKFNAYSKIIQSLLERGAKVNVKNQTKPYGKGNKRSEMDTPLHLACKHWASPQTIQLLISFGSNVSETNNETPLHLVCEGKKNKKTRKGKKQSPSKIKTTSTTTNTINTTNTLKRLHEEVEETNEISEIEEIEKQKSLQKPSKKIIDLQIQIADILIKSGANLDAKNKLLPEELADSNELSNFIKSARAIIQDLRQLSQISIGSDILHQAKGKKPIYVYSRLMKIRLGKMIPHQTLLQIYSKNPPRVIKSFLEWVYSGWYQGNRNKKYIKKILEQTEFDQDFFIKKTGRVSVVEDLKKFYLESTTKNVKIFVSNSIIKAHSSILIARCRFFRDSFNNLPVESFKQIIEFNDPCKSNPETFTIFIKFLYTNTFEEKISQMASQELLKLADFYGLNSMAHLAFQLKVINSKEDSQQLNNIKKRRKNSQF
ncbi:ankyrin repeat-containing protein [Anaeramoeba flamelloides]|uniref:Ankyrin repeat-containing protein n=1 Tax=Anaeramoeba flamelloides TaxID=1746091 RepID=A0ABQ8YC41_9EUKA|nr:ankyrin repeat-containing protein [Anaeramoeba flamelloides]